MKGQAGRGATSRDAVPIPRRAWGRLAGALAALYLLITLLLGWFWSREPAAFDVSAHAAALTGERTHLAGAVTAATHVGVVDTLLHKRGGYLRNDRFPPGLWLDNMPAWEYGVLLQVRDMSAALERAKSRPREGGRSDEDLAEAVSRFAADSTRWKLPAPEREYRHGLAATERYLARLVDDDAADAHFYARAWQLEQWLAQVALRLDQQATRLNASVGVWVDPARVSTEALGRERREQRGLVEVRTPRLRVDRVFYEARGSSWALLHYLQAVEQDFAEVLRQRQAMPALNRLILELEGTQRPLRSPMVLNGSGFGLLPNHSLALALRLERAGAALADLREALEAG